MPLKNIPVRVIFMLFILLLISLGIFLYSYFVESNTLKIERINFALDCPQVGLAEKKIVQISDLHFTRKTPEVWLNKISEAISAQNPSLVFITGDFIDRRGGEENAIELVEKIAKNFPVYAVFGNHDSWANDIDKFKKELENAGAKVLVNEATTIKFDGEQPPINLLGVRDPYTSPDPRSDLKTALEKMEGAGNNCKILLAHAPAIAEAAEKNNIDLVLTGHTHGGQIYIPLVTAKVIPVKHGGSGFVKGLYKLGLKTQMYVNRGIGTTLFPFRFLVPPEITVITLAKP